VSKLELETVESWAKGLEDLGARISSRFTRSEPRERAVAYMRGLMSHIPRKNGWQLAEYVGDASPDGIQRLLNAAVWDVDGVRDDLRSYVVEEVGTPEATLVIDETGFLKKGTHSVGVKRQYSGTAGRIENCQIGVFLAYASAQGHALIDRELYLPEEWAADVTRRKAARVPAEIEFQTKPELARHMLEDALAAGVPCQWVTGDSIYGGDRSLRVWLEERQQWFVLGVAKNESLWSGFAQKRADERVAELSEEEWQTLSCGEGAKGPRLYDWALLPLPRIGQGAHECHALLARRSLENGELAYFVVFAPTDTPLQTLVNVAGQRWMIEECFEIAKDAVGLDEYEVRQWTAWYRHITLSMLVLAFLTVSRSRAVDDEGAKKRSRRTAATDRLRSPKAAH
jgi:SRSO17 transposase